MNFFWDSDSVNFRVNCSKLGAIKLSYEHWLASSVFLLPYSSWNIPSTLVVNSSVMTLGEAPLYSLTRRVWKKVFNREKGRKKLSKIESRICTFLILLEWVLMLTPVLFSFLFQTTTYFRHHEKEFSSKGRYLILYLSWILVSLYRFTSEPGPLLPFLCFLFFVYWLWVFNLIVLCGTNIKLFW